MVGEVNGILLISDLSVGKDGAVKSALVMQQSGWRREIRRDKESANLPYLRGLADQDIWSLPYTISARTCYYPRMIFVAGVFAKVMD